MTVRLDPVAGAGSWLARLDPRWKLAALVPAALAIAFVRHWPTAAASCTGSLLLVAAARLPLSWYLARVGTALLFVVPFALMLPFFYANGGPRWQLGAFQVSLLGLAAGLLLLLKCTTIVTLMSVLFATASLHATLTAAQALRMPRLLVQLALLTYRYVFVLAAELARLRIALRVRGYRTRASRHCYRTAGHVAGTLLLRGAERAERVGQAMRCRGFDGRFRSLAEFRTTRADVAFFVLILVSAAALLIWDHLGIFDLRF